MRWMPKRGEAWPRALKVRSTTSGAHSAKANAASAVASSDRAASAAGEPAVEATTAAVPSRPCYGTKRHSHDGDYQSSYLFYFHAVKFGPALLASDCAPVGFYGVT